MSTVTYSPYTKTFYRGSLEKGDFAHADNYEPIAVLHPERTMGDGRLEFEAEVMRRAERQQRDAVITATEINSITNVDMLQQVIGSMWKNTFARSATTSIPVPKLQLNVPVRSAKMAARAKVGELNVANESNTEFTSVAFNLYKNVVDVFASIEARLRGTIEPLDYDIKQAAGALGNLANTQIATLIETATTASKGDWGAKTSGDSDRDPIDDILTEFVVMNDLHYNPNYLCMHPRVWGDLLGNTNFTKGTAAAAVTRDLNGVFPLPIVNGITAVVDSAFTNTKATLLDSSTVLLGEGPIVSEQYRDARRGADGYIVRQFHEPKLATNDGSRTMTSVSA